MGILTIQREKKVYLLIKGMQVSDYKDEKRGIDVYTRKQENLHVNWYNWCLSFIFFLMLCPLNEPMYFYMSPNFQAHRQQAWTLGLIIQ